jgi:hypothetical protein
VDFKAPTETEFAKAVTKDMVGGLTSIAEVKMLLYIVPLALLFALIAYFLSR